MRPNPVKRAMKAGQPAVGTWLSLGSITAARFLARAGFPWLTVDIEHSLATCRKHGVAPGIHCMSAEEARHRVEEGWQFVAVTSELKMMLDGVQAVMKGVGLQQQGEAARY